MPKITFSSAELPAGLNDQARFSLWRELYTARYGTLEIARAQDRPFSVQFAYTSFGSIGTGQFEGTISRVARTSHAIAADNSDDFCLVLNRSQTPMSSLSRGKEVALPPGAATLYSDSEIAELRTAEDYAVCALVVPRNRLTERVAKAEDLIGVPLDANHAAVRLLRRYIDLALADGGLDDPAVAALATTTVLDLVALALGAAGDVAAATQMRGLRAARLKEILGEIGAGFADAAFSPQMVARRLGVSPRYVQRLLEETGSTFTARVLELRLQRARAMLADPRHDRLKIGEIANACGFNEIPYFNRCFRRRFGASPSQLRSPAPR